MGIINLLPMFRSSMSAFDITKFRGRRCAIDGFGWMHMAIRRCGRVLLTSENVGCQEYLDQLMHKILLLQKNNIEVTVVFDGKPLPAKNDTQQSRRAARRTHLEMAKQLDMAGDSIKATEYFNKAVTVTHRMVCNWIHLLEKVGAKYVIAPYEADAQLAFLARSRKVDFVITEDSDLIIYECPCIVFKFDREGRGDLFKLECLSYNTDEHLPLTPYMLRQACILSQCDYFSGLPGIGLKRGLKLIQQHSTVSDAIKQYCSQNPATDFAQTFLDYKKAEATFCHQVIIDDDGVCSRLSAALSAKRATSTIHEQNDSDLAYAGEIPYANPETVVAVCVAGLANPQTLFVECQQDFEKLGVECSKCEQKPGDCQCERILHEVYYRDALLCQHKYEERYIFDPNDKVEEPAQPAVVFAKCTFKPSYRYKKRKVAYVETTDDECPGEDLFPTPPK